MSKPWYPPSKAASPPSYPAFAEPKFFNDGLNDKPSTSTGQALQGRRVELPPGAHPSSATTVVAKARS